MGWPAGRLLDGVGDGARREMAVELLPAAHRDSAKAVPDRTEITGRSAAMDRQQVTTVLTVVLVGMWIITAVARIWISWPEAHVLDSVMPSLVGYWFLTKVKNGAVA
jgi:hypothetical protein